MKVMSVLRCAAAVALGLGSVTLLAGCAGQQLPYADLQVDRQSEDELPKLADYAYDNLNESTSRFIGEHDGTSLWIAAGDKDESICLVTVAGDDLWVAACGGGPTKMGGITGSFEIVPDGVPGPEGATKLSENVYAW